MPDIKDLNEIKEKAGEALDQVSKAMELGEKGIRVNTVQPAATATSMYTEFMQLKATANETEVKIKENPRQFLGMNAPLDVANAIIFLLSPASRTITGVHIPVDGGFACC